MCDWRSYPDSVWAPGVGGGPLMTRWFYERARGQYMDALVRSGTPTAQKQFKQRHPLGQKFVKTDVAKFENTWAQLPNTVALGADKNFSAYMLRIDSGASGDMPDRDFFEALVAKALLFRTAERLIGGLRLGGYRSQTVTYTLALLARRVGSDIDLNEVWRLQELPAKVSSLIEELAPAVHAEIITSAGRSNVSEHAKLPACWEAVQLILPGLGGALGRAGGLDGAGRVPIEVDYDGFRTRALFNRSDQSVEIIDGPLEGQRFKSPSGAAVAVVRHFRPEVDANRNGWVFCTVGATGELLRSIR